MLMSTETITLQIDADAVRAFKSAPVDEQEKLQALLGVWLKEYARADAASLQETMNRIGENAKSRGLTSEMLESILEEQ